MPTTNSASRPENELLLRIDDEAPERERARPRPPAATDWNDRSARDGIREAILRFLDEEF